MYGRIGHKLTVASLDEFLAWFRGQCAFCYVKEAVHIHHIRPKSMGGNYDDWDNLIPLCYACHDFVTEHGARNFIDELTEARDEAITFFAHPPFP